MISNGSLITEDIARGMIEAGLDAINISVDASGKEVFESTRLNLDYDTVIGNIRTLARLRKESGRTHPKLILSFVRQNNSADEQAFIEEWRQIADKSLFDFRILPPRTRAQYCPLVQCRQEWA
jgi:sulfatase maturation enzyme AslB (radical SAM superfamily)